MRHKYMFAGLALLIFAAATVGTGCIVSGQFVLLMAGTDTIESSDPDLDPLYVDVTGEDVWQDHHDEIQSILDIKFECEFVNNTDHTEHGELWISTNGYTTVDQVRTPGNAVRVFSGLELGSGESKAVAFSESAAYIENLDAVLDLLETGKFYLYGIVPPEDEPYSLTVQGLDPDDPENPGRRYPRFLITFSAGS